MAAGRPTRWSDWLGLLAGISSFGTAALIAVAVLIAVSCRMEEPRSGGEFHLAREVFFYSSPGMIRENLRELLPVPALAAALGGLGLALATRGGWPSTHRSAAAVAVRSARVGLAVGGGIVALVLTITVGLIGLRWYFWG